ncbi:MAG: hypothetical protein A2Y38_16460 [Spirochaetes bacterium GWB1_59_5]|nr:MAG: hypothetical protein A2Y38_16460 [Spirochaetes bacterium GWB1_59_5]
MATQASWILETAGEGSLSGIGGGAIGDVYGTGLIHPLVFDGVDFLTASGPALVANAVSQILGTLGGSDDVVGELPWDTEFGSILPRLRFRKMDLGDRELAKFYIADALNRWEPRIQVHAASVSKDEDAGSDNPTTLIIRLRYSLVAANNPNNRVFTISQTLVV